MAIFAQINKISLKFYTKEQYNLCVKHVFWIKRPDPTCDEYHASRRRAA